MKHAYTGPSKEELDSVFGRPPGEARLNARVIGRTSRDGSHERGLILIVNAAGANEIIGALKKTKMKGFVAAMEAALTPKDDKSRDN